MLAQILIYTGIALNAIATLGYVVETVRGNVKPNRVTFFIWSIAPLVAFFAQKSQGVGVQALMTLSVGVFPFTIFVASFLNKKAYWKMVKFDFVCGLFSILGLILWQLTKIGNIAIFFSILADLLAMMPTLVKGYRFPDTEMGWPWLVAAISGLLTLLSIQAWTFEYYGFTLYYLIATLALFIIIQFRIGKKMKLVSLTKFPL